MSEVTVETVKDLLKKVVDPTFNKNLDELNQF